MRHALLFAALAVGPFATTAVPAVAETAPATAKVRFIFETGAETGKIMVVVYDSAGGYDGGGPVRAAEVDVAAGRHEAVFENLPAGDYAMKAFHDVNGNGRMDANPFGMPTEPFAFSNNARGNMGPASWDRARFAVSGEVVQTIVIR